MSGFPRRLIPGQPISARTINLLLGQAERVIQMAAAGPLALSQTPLGPLLEDQTQQPFPALLTSNASPYTFVEVLPGPSGAFTEFSGGRAGSAYEANARPGFLGAIVWLSFTTAGDYRFYVPRLGGGVTGTIKGCNNFTLPGGTWTVQDHTSHATLGTITTNSGGAISGSPAVTVGQSIDLIDTSGRFALKTITVAAGPSFGTISLTPSSSYVCLASTTGCAWPLSKTVHLTDPVYGAQTLTYNSLSGTWIGTTTTANFPTPLAGSACFAGCPAITPGTMTIRWTIDTSLRIVVEYLGYVSLFGTCPAVIPGQGPGTQFYAFPLTAATSFTCPKQAAFSAAWSLNGTGMNVLYSSLLSCIATLGATE
jgi:hypothetical protein